MREAKLGKTFLVRLETGEEIVRSITEFARGHSIDAASVSAIGAAYGVVLGYFDRERKEYLRHSVAGEVEIVSLQGNISLKEGLPFPHLHIVVSGRDFRPMAGHFFEGKAAATVEIIIRPLPGYVSRAMDEATGLYLLDL